MIDQFNISLLLVLFVGSMPGAILMVIMIRRKPLQKTMLLLGSVIAIFGGIAASEGFYQFFGDVASGYELLVWAFALIGFGIVLKLRSAN